MRLKTVALGITLMLISVFAFAQSRTHNPDKVLARLRYDGGHIIDWRQEPGNPQICFALYGMGHYRVSRLTERGNETLQGRLTKDQLWQLLSALKELDLRSR